jgi:hypothetical protein
MSDADRVVADSQGDSPVEDVDSLVLAVMDVRRLGTVQARMPWASKTASGS